MYLLNDSDVQRDCRLFYDALLISSLKPSLVHQIKGQ